MNEDEYTVEFWIDPDWVVLKRGTLDFCLGYLQGTWEAEVLRSGQKLIVRRSNGDVITGVCTQ